MIRKVHLYGHLRRKFGDVFELDADTPADVIRALNANFPGTFMESIREGSYRLVRGHVKRGMDFDETQLDFKLGKADFHLMPAMIGSGGRGGGILKIVLGVALIGLAVFSAGVFTAGLAGLATPIGGGILGGLTYGNLAMLGLALVAGGVASLMTSKEKPKQEVKREESFTFSGPRNAQEQGGPVPLIYGRVMTGSIPISAGFDIEQL